MVVSGINLGANLGDDVLYSGTVAAAIEGRFTGRPAFAFVVVAPARQSFYSGVHRACAGGEARSARAAAAHGA